VDCVTLKPLYATGEKKSVACSAQTRASRVVSAGPFLALDSTVELRQAQSASPATPSLNCITSYYSRTPSIFSIACFFSVAIYSQRLFCLICKFQWLLEPACNPRLILTVVQPRPANLPLPTYRQLSPRFAHIAASPFVVLCINPLFYNLRPHSTNNWQHKGCQLHSLVPESLQEGANVNPRHIPLQAGWSQHMLYL
jgi:hypothetical protein